MKKILFIFTIATFVLGSLQAQPGKAKENWKDYADNADLLMSQGSYYNALDNYKKALELNSGDLDLKFRQAEAYRAARDYRRAASSYRSVKKKLDRGKGDKAAYPLINFHYAMMLKQSGEYMDAEEIFFQFVEDYDGSEGERYREIAKKQYEGCQIARMGAEDVVMVERIDALGRKVNSKYTEFGPMPLEDGTLMFGSLKKNEVIDLATQKEYARMYLAKVEDFDKVKDVEKMSIRLNDKTLHIGNGTISKDGQRMYLTVCEQQPGAETDCAIHVAERLQVKEKYAWGRPKKMPAPVNMDGSESTTPFVLSASTGDVLYFASNRSGGQGGMDLYAAMLDQEGNISGVVNLGDKVNTPGDEISPFIDEADGYEDPRPRLYFSSDGHPGYGGMDVFMAYQTNVNFTAWTPAKNAGVLLNSSADDMYFVLDKTATTAYLVTNRKGGSSITGAGSTCCDDIFVAELQGPKLEKTIIADLRGKVYDENKKEIKGAKLDLFHTTPSRNFYKNGNTGVGGYNFENIQLDKRYVLELKVDGYLPQQFEFNTRGLRDSKVFTKDFYLEKEAEEIKTREIRIWTTTDATSKDGKPVPGARIVIEDKTGKKLGEYTTDSKGEIRFNLPEGTWFKATASKDGYLSISGRGELRNEGKKIEFGLEMKEARKDVVFTLDNIYYDFNSAKLRDESIPNLNKLLKLLNENPRIIIELRSHTDSKGSDSYNLSLSQKRAQSVVDWLIEKGITQSRLVPKGYGESQPIVSNTNPDGSDNPENRQKNRRTEFKIIGGVGGN